MSPAEARKLHAGVPRTLRKLADAMEAQRDLDGPREGMELLLVALVDAGGALVREGLERSAPGMLGLVAPKVLALLKDLKMRPGSVPGREEVLRGLALDVEAAIDAADVQGDASDHCPENIMTHAEARKFLNEMPRMLRSMAETEETALRTLSETGATGWGQHTNNRAHVAKILATTTEVAAEVWAGEESRLIAAAAMLKKVAVDLRAVGEDMTVRPDPMPGRAEVLLGLVADIEAASAAARKPPSQLSSMKPSDSPNTNEQDSSKSKPNYSQLLANMTGRDLRLRLLLEEYKKNGLPPAPPKYVLKPQRSSEGKMPTESSPKPSESLSESWREPLSASERDQSFRELQRWQWLKTFYPQDKDQP